MPATVAVVAVAGETVACQWSQQLRTRLLQAPAVSAVTAVDDADTVTAAAAGAPVAGQQSVMSHCTAAEQPLGDVVAAAVTSLLSFLQRPMSEVQ